MFSWLKRIFSGSEIPDTTNEATRKETIASSSTHSPSLHTQHAFLNDEEKLERYGQSRSHKKDDARWVLPGEKVTAHGFEIADGMVYVGNFLTAAPNGGWNADTPAPCLIRPSLKVASGVPQTNLDLGYWPSYTDITPHQRLTYLLWLASGKSDTSYPMGYPFLYFYGLERRLIADSPSIDEEVLLIAEVKRLRELFGHNSSFVNYSTELLNFVEMKHAVTDIPRVAAWKPDLAALGNHMSPLLQAKLGLHALRGMPLDVDLAIAGILSLPPHLTGLWPRVATTRARPEFIELTRHRFNQKFPHGFRLRDKKESRLDLNYLSASQYLHTSIKFEGIDRLPDPAQLTWTKMIKLCEGVREDLSAFAKVVGKERERADSMAAALMLPAELGERETVRSFRDWLDNLPQPLADVSLEELGLWCFGSGKAASGLRQARDMSAMLARVGYGMEPDPTYGGTRPGENIILFRIGDAQGQLISVGADFHTATLIMTAIGPAAKNMTLGSKLVDALATRLRLAPHETKRLTARLQLLPERLPTLGRFKTVVESAEPEQRTALASLAASVAVTIGETDQGMMVALERLYEAFGLGRRELYTVLHQGTAATASYASEPIVVEDDKSRRRGHRIPAPPSKAKSQDGIVIDMSKVGVILRETKEVDAILAPIYEEEASEIPISVAVSPTLEQETKFVGLGPEQARLLEALVNQPKWTRSGFEAKARELGLMPDGALEAINEWAYDTFDEELIVDGDPLIINMALLADAPGSIIMTNLSVAASNGTRTAEKIKPKDRDGVIQALRAGVVPRSGIQLVQVGRAGEVNQVVQDVKRIADGGSAVRFIIGDYGAGKTFFLNLTRSIAMQSKLVVAHADLSPDRRLHASGGQARSLYAELMRNMATRTKQDGGALASVVERFIMETQASAKASGRKIGDVIQEKLLPIQELVSGYDFATVIEYYWRAFEEGSESGKAAALRWLRGEYTLKTEAREALGVRSIIDDASVYDYLKVMSRFVTLAGYSGFLVMLDECVNLFKLVSAQSRNANYEQILRIVNDVLQGSAESLGVYFGGTPEFLMDSRRGLYSYEALRSRLAENSFARNGLVDLSGPVIRLQSLTPEDLYILLGKLRHVFAYGDQDRYLVPDEVFNAFMTHCNQRVGEAYFRTPRNTIKSFLDLLAILEQNPQAQWQGLVDQAEIAPDAPSAGGNIIDDDNKDAPGAAGSSTTSSTQTPPDDDLADFRL